LNLPSSVCDDGEARRIKKKGFLIGPIIDTNSAFWVGSERLSWEEGVSRARGMVLPKNYSYNFLKLFLPKTYKLRRKNLLKNSGKSTVKIVNIKEIKLCEISMEKM
jgi:hypothetical protein